MIAARGWARLPLCSGLCLCAGCMVDHLVYGDPVFASGMGAWDRGRCGGSVSEMMRDAAGFGDGHVRRLTLADA